MMKSGKKFIIIGEIWQCDDFNAKQWVEKDHVDYPRKETGEYPVTYPVHAVLDVAKERKLFNGFRIGQKPSDEKVRGADPENYFLQIDLLRATLDYKRPEFSEGYASYDDFVQDYYDKIFSIQQQYPETVWLDALGEIDSSCPWPKDHSFTTREEAYEYFKEAAFKKRIGSGDPVSLFSYMADNNLTLKNSNIMIHGAALFAVHYYFEWGFPFVEIERGLGASLNMQTSAAFIRGAWKQHGRDAHWGIDFSLHHPHRNQCTWYNAEGQRCGGHSENLTLRCWMYTFLAGADALLQEGSDYSHWVFSEDGSFKLSPLGEMSERFAAFTLQNDLDRGEPVTPVAIMLNYYHGYESQFGVCRQQPLIWGNCLPCKTDDLNIGNTLSIFYPGHESVDADFDHCFNPDVPWKTQWEYLDMLKQGHDMRPYEKGHLVESPYGDCTDVFLDNVAIDVLKEYPVLILAGPQRHNDESDNKLSTYIRGGGTLCTALNQLSENMQKQLNIQKMKSLSSDWDYDEITVLDGNVKFANMRYGFTRLTIPGALVLAVNHRQIPLIWEVPFGQGKIILSAIPYAQDVAGSSIMPAWAHIIGKETETYFPAKDSNKTLQLCVNRTEKGWLIAAFNNQLDQWNGTIEFSAPGNGFTNPTICEVWDNKDNIIVNEKTFGKWTFSGIVPEFSFKIYKVDFQ